MTIPFRPHPLPGNYEAAPMEAVAGDSRPVLFDIVDPALWATTAAESTVPYGVVLPAHYTRFEIEPVYFIAQNKLGFMEGNVIKYVCRWDAKDGVKDLYKARRYLDMIIKKAEGDPSFAA